MFRKLAALCAALATATSCGPHDGSSADAAAFQQFLITPHPVASARWEIFSTPEADGIPGPTDYRTLIAEVRPPWPQDGAPTPSENFPPNAVRPWLGDGSRQVLTRAIAGSPLPSDSPCWKVATAIRSSGRKRPGIACAAGDSTLLVVELLH